MMNAVVKPYHEMCLNSSELIVPRDTYQRALHPRSSTHPSLPARWRSQPGAGRETAQHY